MAKINEKRFFTQFETTEQEKEELKRFVDKKNINMSQFIRSCIRFFKNRNLTPEEYLMKEVDTKTVSSKGIPVSFLQDLERRELEVKGSLDAIHKEIRNMKTSISNDMFEYISTIAQELDRAKGE